MIGLAWLAATVVVAPASGSTSENSPPTPVVLVMPLGAVGGVEPQVAEQITQEFVVQASRVPGFTVRSIKDMQDALGIEQMKQHSGCTDASCALEIAGALNADQLITGTIGKIDTEYLITMTRLRTRDASVLGRVSERVKNLQLSVVLDRIPALTSGLMGVPLPTPAPVPAPAPVTPAPTAAAPSSALPRVLRAAGIGALVVSVLPLLGSVGSGGVVLVGSIYDLAGGARPWDPATTHAVPFWFGQLSNGLFLLAAVSVVVAGVAAAAGLGALVASMVMP